MIILEAIAKIIKNGGEKKNECVIKVKNQLLHTFLRAQKKCSLVTMKMFPQICLIMENNSYIQIMEFLKSLVLN